ncbi:cytochrome c551 [Halobacillus litoralis]|uniref:cytochrome c551 n=1 Tax=Halobacillus litoralis TaxID=45668 RepID=UPI00248F5DA2|nr:cytochrome c [Halobacillus litoralis]
MKKLMFALFMGLILVLSACGGGGDEENADDNTTEEQEGSEESTEEGADEGSTDGGDGETVDAQAAEEVYQNSCASCHGGELGGGFGPSLQKVGADHSADEIVEIIQNGKGSMPAQEQVSEEDAQLVASWLETKK